MKRIVALAEASGVPVWTLPGIHDLISGRVGIQELREVSIDDLLGRQPVSLDWQAISAGLAEHVVLVTGGAGSIGSELCRQLGHALHDPPPEGDIRGNVLYEDALR